METIYSSLSQAARTLSACYRCSHKEHAYTYHSSHCTQHTYESATSVTKPTQHTSKNSATSCRFPYTSLTHPSPPSRTTRRCLCIRPLCLCQEQDIQQFAIQQNYQKQIKNCPYEHTTNRQLIKQVFNHLQQLNPQARYSIWNALETEQKLTEY